MHTVSVLLTAVVIAAGPAWAAAAADLYFTGAQDLVWKTPNLAVGRKIDCELALHYEGSGMQAAIVRVRLDGQRLISFPVIFERPGEVQEIFQFRVERSGKHSLEFFVDPFPQIREANTRNNRFSVAFTVPGPAPRAAVPLVAQREQGEGEPPAPVAPSEEIDQAMGLSRMEPPAFVDVFFDPLRALRGLSRRIVVDEPVSWVLEVTGQGSGAAEVEVVVADGDRKLFSQPVWIRAGQTYSIPLKTVFSRPGRHRLAAMVNTHKQVVDADTSNNIIEKTLIVEERF